LSPAKQTEVPPPGSGEAVAWQAKTPVSTSVTVTVPNHLMPRLVGPLNENLRLLEGAFAGTLIHARGNEFTFQGPDADVAAKLVDELRLLLEQGQTVDPQVVHRTIDMVRADERPSEVLASEVLRSARGRSVRPKTSGQRRYADAIQESIVTFGVGPAGTGKSYLAVALGVQALQGKQVDRIILTRPAVEAGERLGFLPGDLMAKIDPYLRPLYDALYDMLGTEGARRLLDAGTVEVAPLAYMRGRTLNNSFIILDEAQNTTPEQMKMFLTRIGFGSKVVVTGDDSQIDLPGGRSGLVGLEEILIGIEGLSWVRLDRRDVVRHRIVGDIVHAFEIAANRSPRSGSGAGQRPAAG
jgi:phosphate starvation-inducible PhoH-like protein